jgi:hypothetical protein
MGVPYASLGRAPHVIAQLGTDSTAVIAAVVTLLPVGMVLAVLYVTFAVPIPDAEDVPTTSDVDADADPAFEEGGRAEPAATDASSTPTDPLDPE